MQSRALEILVGFFVCLGVAAVFVLTFRAASIDNVGKGPTYRVIASFDNIGGLKIGAAVTMAGVKVGRVRQIVINKKTFQADVGIDFSEQYNNIPDDSNVKILTAGLLGEQYLGVEPGGSDTFLKNGSVITLTQSALVLENLIGQFLADKTGGSDKSSGGGQDDKLADAINKLADSLKPREAAAPGAAK